MRPLTILLTGFTSRQANTVSAKADIYITFAPILKKVLERLGHTVDWRPVTFAESDIEKYDIVFCGCSDPNSMTGQGHRYGAIWSMIKAQRLVLWFDDWRIKGQLHSFLKKPSVFWETRMLHEAHLSTHARALEFKDPIDNMLFGLSTDHKAPIVAQLFNWGNEAKFLKEAPDAKWLLRFDPSAYVPNFVEKIIPMEERKRSWVAASLTQMDDFIEKLKLQWPVTKQAKPAGRAFGGWKKMHEKDVVTELYATHAGLLSKPYPHAGSGWWRVRFNYAAHTNTVMLADQKEVTEIGSAYRYSAAEIESLSASGLEALAVAQYVQLRGWEDSELTVATKMARYIDRVMQEPSRPRYM